MSDIFQFQLGDEASPSGNVFEKYDLPRNPFPESGLDSGVLYVDHMKEELQAVNTWIRAVTEATTSGARANPVPPLAVFGSLGAGKTHLLRTLERGMEANRKSPVLRKGLADEGMTRLVLANLFLRYLPMSETDEPNAEDEPVTLMIREIVRRLRRQELRNVRDIVDVNSPLARPFQTVLHENADARAQLWFSRWLRREHTTPTQRAKLGLGGVLDSEGQAVRAVSDLLRIARHVDLIDVWVVMIDQLEELWREGVITASRRARFLTDLRMFIDQALEAAPVALLLAWNTTTAGPHVVGESIRADYHALWQRLGEPVDLPLLREKDVWGFARAYLTAADVHDGASEPRARLFHRLQEATETVVSEMKERSPIASAFAPREVLRRWRTTANELAQA